MVKVETSNPKSLKAMSIIAILIGIGLGIFSLYLYYDYNSKKETYIPTKGVVVDYEEKKDIGEDRYTYAAIVEFEVDGKKYRVTQNSSSIKISCIVMHDIYGYQNTGSKKPLNHIENKIYLVHLKFCHIFCNREYHCLLLDFLFLGLQEHIVHYDVKAFRRLYNKQIRLETKDGSPRNRQYM